MRLKSRYILKLAAFAVAIVLVLSVLYFYQHERTTEELRDQSSAAMEQALLRETRDAGKVFARALASSLFEPIALDDFEQISNITASVLDLPNVSDIQVFNTDGKVINDGTETVASYGIPISRSIHVAVLEEKDVWTDQNGQVLAVAAPIQIGERNLGGVSLRLDIDNALANIDSLNRELANIIERDNARFVAFAVLFAIIVSVVGACVGVLIAHRLTGRIIVLNALTHRIAHGQYDIELPPTRPDELGELAVSFQSMARELNATTVLKSELESLIQTRTQELEGANSKLLEVDRVRRDFLSDMSHELRTPLTAIRGTAEVAIRNPDGSDQSFREALQRVVTHSEQLAELINDFMFIARSESGVVDLNKEWMVLEEPIADAMRAVQAMWPTADIQLELDENAEVCVVEGDQKRLRQLFTILIDNAVKYSDEEESVQIVVQRTPTETGGMAEVRVTDRGIGMTDSEKRKIFDRFFRGTRARETQGGMGLGLAIAGTIARTHSAELLVQSEEGIGTTFSFHIALLNDTDELHDDELLDGLPGSISNERGIS